MRRSAHSPALSSAVAVAMLASGVGSCTYDFDKFDQPAATEGGASGLAGNPTAGSGAPYAGSSVGGATDTAPSGAGSDGEMQSGDGGDGGSEPSSTGGTSSSSGGASPTGGAPATAGASGAAVSAGGGGSFDCAKVSGTLWNDRCYFAVGTGMRWEAAKAACAENGSAHLVTITSAAEDEVLQRAFGTLRKDFWIGLSLRDPSRPPARSCERTPKDCPFSWVTGEELAYTRWAEHSATDREPNYTGSCVRVQSNGFAWADYDCGNALSAICEHEN